MFKMEVRSIYRQGVSVTLTRMGWRKDVIVRRRREMYFRGKDVLVVKYI